MKLIVCHEFARHGFPEFADEAACGEMQELNLQLNLMNA
jgi:hypothetical protein